MTTGSSATPHLSRREVSSFHAFRSDTPRIPSPLSDTVQPGGCAMFSKVARLPGSTDSAFRTDYTDCVLPIGEVFAVSPRSQLAAWQIARLTTHVEDNLQDRLFTVELAVLARLSVFHFCRVFRNTFGCSPHKYVVRQRVARAQNLMLTTTLPLAQIAADCGMADQAHLSRRFRQFVGETPGAWRRAHPVMPGE
jgi:AraC-like DNA-binding protein